MSARSAPSTPDGFGLCLSPFVFVGSDRGWLSDLPGVPAGAQRTRSLPGGSLGSSLVHSPSITPGRYFGAGTPRVRCFECGGEAATSNGEPDKYLSLRLNRRKLSMGTSDCRRPNHKRGVVKDFTEGASGRLGLYAEECKAVYPFMGTLTVDGEYSSDPKDFRAAIDRYLVWFMRQMKRACNPDQSDLQSILWWVEFQRRGAPHLHFFYTTRVPWQDASLQWQTICERFGLSSRPDFWKSATKFEKVRCGWRGVASYARKYASKHEQKIPDRLVYDWQGRYWGVRGYRDTESIRVTRTTDEAWAYPELVPAWLNLQDLLDDAVKRKILRRCDWQQGKGASYFPVGGWSRQSGLLRQIHGFVHVIADGAVSC